MYLNAINMYKMCLRKVKYKTQQYAEEKAKEYEEKYNIKHYVYFCPLCGNYHLTTKQRT